MKKFLKFVVFVFGLMGLGVCYDVAALTETWGPQDRQTYLWNAPASEPVFNSITDNPALGDERNFVRVREYNADYSGDIEDGLDDDFVDYVDIEPGKEYEIYVYYHNDASESFNASGVGIAQNVRLKMEIPSELNDGDTAVIKGTISWGTEGNMQEVWDTAFLTAYDAIRFEYVSESGAVIHNRGTANGAVLDKNALFSYGALLAYDERYWGVIPGCNNFAGYVTFKIKAVGEEEPDAPEEPEEPDEPETPEEPEEPESTDEIVNTGPAEITLAIMIVLVVGISAYYTIKTRLALKDTEDIVRGKK